MMKLRNIIFQFRGPGPQAHCLLEENIISTLIVTNQLCQQSITADDTTVTLPLSFTKCTRQYYKRTALLRPPPVHTCFRNRRQQATLSPETGNFVAENGDCCSFWQQSRLFRKHMWTGHYGCLLNTHQQPTHRVVLARHLESIV